MAREEYTFRRRNWGGTTQALSGVQLSELTHEPGTPWSNARVAAGVSAIAASNAEISKEVDS